MRRRALLGGGMGLVLAGACGRRPAGADGPASRVVSVTLLSDAILWQLGETARARVVGVSSLVDDPTYSGVADTWPGELPRVPGKAEPILALAPDLAFLSTYTPAETVAMLEGTGLRIVQLTATGRFEAFHRDLDAIARAMAMVAEGQRLRDAFDARVEALRVRGRTHRPGLVLLDGTSTLGADSSFQDLCDLLDADNLAADQGIGAFGELAAEKVIALDPEWVVVPCSKGACDSPAKALAERPGFAGLSAVKAGRIIAVPRAVLYAVDERVLDAAQLVRDRLGAGSSGP